jgi:Raf kinase inhibitor-like YbhB/YbcL family protein
MITRRHALAVLPLTILFVAVILPAVAQDRTAPAGGKASMPFGLKSSAFAAGGEIPQKYTCVSGDASPALEWSGAPARTASFAVIMDDPDAPAGTWVHWVLWNLPATTHSLSEGIAKSDHLPDGSRQGRNDFRKTGYYGPCPPPGKTHRYFFRLYALDTTLNLSPGASRGQLDEAMKGHILGEAEYIGTFRR